MANNDNEFIYNKTVINLTFIEFLFALLIGWLLVELWKVVLFNFAFNTLRLDKQSTFQTFVFTLAITIIFLAYIFTTESIIARFANSSSGGGNPPVPETPERE